MDKIRNIIIEAINELNEQMNEKDRIEITDTLVLMGNGSTIDSLDFVSLMVSIEDKIFNEYNKSITTVSEKAFSNKYNPFGSIDKLSSFIGTLLEN